MNRKIPDILALYPCAHRFNAVAEDPDGGIIVRLLGRETRLNAPAAAILGLCDGNRNLSQIADALSGEFDLPITQMRQVVTDSVNSLSASSLVYLSTSWPPVTLFRHKPHTLLNSDIESQIRFRMGRFYHATQAPDWQEGEMPPGSSLLRFEYGRVEYDGPDPAPHQGRLNGFLEKLRGLEIPKTRFNMLFAGGDGAKQHPTWPINGYFRVTGSDATILWPLGGYTELNSDNFGRWISRDDCTWENKIERAVWRGTTTGQSWCGLCDEEIERNLERRYHAVDRVGGRTLPRGNRLTLVSRYLDADFADVGLSSTAETDEAARAYFARRNFVKPRLPRTEMLRYKYQIVADGNSFASQLPWTLHCASVVLMVPPSFESIMADIQPWRHFVPLAPDYSDLEEKVDWCRSHDADCREISATATRLMREYYDPEKEQRVRQGLLERYARNFPAA